MKNVVVSSVAYMIVPLFMFGCSGQSKQSKEKDVITESGSIKCPRKYAIHLRT